MSRVSLIVLKPLGMEWPSERVAAYRAGLEDAGFPVEVVAVIDPTGPIGSIADEPWTRLIVADAPGVTESAKAGIRASRGSLVVVIDLAVPYRIEDLFGVIGALESGQAEIAVAARPAGLVGRLAARIIGTTDPASGLIGLVRASAIDLANSSGSVGSRFTLEFLTRVAGRRVDVAVAAVGLLSRPSSLRDDLRQLKRLADNRFGNLSRLIQFCFVGASGMVIDLTLYAILKAIFSNTGFATMTTPLVGGSLALAVAAVLAIAPALTWNFSINRRLTFNDARQGSITRQFLRYVLSNLLGIGVNLSLRLILPTQIGFFREHQLTAAVVGIVAATGISFSMARWFVFGQKKAVAKTDRPALIACRRSVDLTTSVSPRVERIEHHDRETVAAAGARRSAKDKVAG